MASQRLGLGSLRLGGLPAPAGPLLGSNLNPELLSDLQSQTRQHGWFAKDANGDIWISTGPGQGDGHNTQSWFNASSARRDLDGGITSKFTLTIEDATTLPSGTTLRGRHRTDLGVGAEAVTFEIVRGGSPAPGNLPIDFAAVTENAGALSALRAAVEGDPLCNVAPYNSVVRSTYVSELTAGSCTLTAHYSDGSSSVLVLSIADIQAYVVAQIGVPTSSGFFGPVFPLSVGKTLTGMDLFVATNFGPNLLPTSTLTFQIYDNGSDDRQVQHTTVAGVSSTSGLSYVINNSSYPLIYFDLRGSGVATSVQYQWQSRGTLNLNTAWESSQPANLQVISAPGASELSTILAQLGMPIEAIGESFEEWNQYQNKGDGETLAAMITAWRAGGRFPSGGGGSTTVFDADFTNVTSVTIPALNPAKKYRFALLVTPPMTLTHVTLIGSGGTIERSFLQTENNPPDTVIVNGILLGMGIGTEPAWYRSTLEAAVAGGFRLVTGAGHAYSNAANPNLPASWEGLTDKTYAAGATVHLDQSASGHLTIIEESP